MGFLCMPCQGTAHGTWAAETGRGHLATWEGGRLTTAGGWLAPGPEHRDAVPQTTRQTVSTDRAASVVSRRLSRPTDDHGAREASNVARFTAEQSDSSQMEGACMTVRMCLYDSIR